MADRTGIEWADATWNPIVGCSVLSPGCTHCYAMIQAARIERMGGPGGALYAGLTQPSKAGPVWTGTLRVNERALDQPLRWRRPRRIFVNSMSDLFHEALDDATIDRVFAVMALAPQHTFMVLTKRAARMRDYLSHTDRVWKLLSAVRRDINPEYREGSRFVDDETPFDWPLPNLWLGVSTEDQERADQRIPDLLATPAAVRFISAEPLLGPVDLTRLAGESSAIDSGADDGVKGAPALDWVIAGGESGPRARPMHPDWARALRDQCQAAGAAFFFKQFGEWAPGENVDRMHGVVETANWWDGRWSLSREDLALDGHRDDEPDLYRVGKRAAGRHLDGVEWSEFPA